MAQFKVAERFVSINGESARAGELAILIAVTAIQNGQMKRIRNMSCFPMRSL